MDRVNELALAIADHAVRSDVECYAHQVSLSKYDLTRPQDNDDDVDQVAIANNAARYIELRGDALPFVMHRQGDVVWFGKRDGDKP